ncbi:MAG: flagellin [Proteobacteria bacterium]|nr:flagellin [Pseudomonadota bacterium]
MVEIRSSLANNVALNYLARNTTAQTRLLQQLSTGLRVTQAREDAASLAIGSRLAAEVGAQGVASQNAAQATSFLQVAEGGVSQVQGLIERAQVLAVQAGSDTLGEAERGFLNQEFQSVLAEIDRISADTEFNGVRPLAGPGTQTFDVQVGTGANAAEDQISADVQATGTAALGLGGLDISSAAGANAATAALSSALDQVVANRADLGATINRFDVAQQAIDTAQINTEAARSTLLDLDVARAITAYTQTRAQGEIAVTLLDRANKSRGGLVNLFA